MPAAGVDPINENDDIHIVPQHVLWGEIPMHKRLGSGLRWRVGEVGVSRRRRLELELQREDLNGAVGCDRRVNDDEGDEDSARDEHPYPRLIVDGECNFLEVISESIDDPRYVMEQEVGSSSSS